MTDPDEGYKAKYNNQNLSKKCIIKLITNQKRTVWQDSQLRWGSLVMSAQQHDPARISATDRSAESQRAWFKVGGSAPSKLLATTTQDRSFADLTR